MPSARRPTSRDPFASRPDKPTHQDLWSAVNRLNERQNEAESRDDQRVHVMQRIEGKLDAMGVTLGSTGLDEHGGLIGTGVAGDLARLKQRVDKRFGRYDSWFSYAAGAVAAACLFTAAIWWLVQDKVAHAFK